MKAEKRSCPKSGKSFLITPDELEWYERLGVPLPTLCPEERLRRRLSYNNPLTVYFRPSSATGNNIFSMFTEDVSFPVIEKDLWWSDSWDPLSFGKEYDFERSFFAQFAELSSEVPRFPLSVIYCENSEYVNYATANKNCYMAFACNDSEDCFYSSRLRRCSDCQDCTELDHCELCWNSTMCQRCYNVQDCVFCEDCQDSYFLRNCRSCRNCFGCSNLIQCSYHVYNKSCSKEEYERFVAQQALSSYSQRERLRAEVEAFHQNFPQPALRLRRSENVLSEYVHDSRDVSESFLIRRCDHVRFGYELSGVRDCLDYSIWGDGAELIYETSTCGDNIYNLKFCYQCFENAADLEYCQFCVSSRHCFGCVGLRSKEYCVLNRQCRPDEYCELTARIRRQMITNKEYGEFFPLEASPIPYNHSLAFWYFPLSEAEAKQGGVRWYNAMPTFAKEVVPAETLPDVLSDSFAPLVVASAQSARPFRITAEEIRRCQKLNVPLPRHTYDERVLKRIQMLGGVGMYERNCAKTGQAICTSYPPDSPWVIWSNEAYEQEYRS